MSMRPRARSMKDNVDEGQLAPRLVLQNMRANHFQFRFPRHEEAVHVLVGRVLSLPPESLVNLKPGVAALDYVEVVAGPSGDGQRVVGKARLGLDGVMDVVVLGLGWRRGLRL